MQELAEEASTDLWHRCSHKADPVEPVLEEWDACGLPKDANFYNHAIRACASFEQGRRALDLVEEAQRANKWVEKKVKLDRTVVKAAYGVAIRRSFQNVFGLKPDAQRRRVQTALRLVCEAARSPVGGCSSALASLEEELHIEAVQAILNATHGADTVERRCRMAWDYLGEARFEGRLTAKGEAAARRRMLASVVDEVVETTEAQRQESSAVDWAIYEPYEAVIRELKATLARNAAGCRG